ncbi:MAG: hypothetical protein LLG14_04230 [Nocardiaceae bacterium]|nr:hypothetical protein [Nocardiaceae bacterium]
MNANAMISATFLAMKNAPTSANHHHSAKPNEGKHEGRNRNHRKREGFEPNDSDAKW